MSPRGARGHCVGLPVLLKDVPVWQLGPSTYELVYQFTQTSCWVDLHCGAILRCRNTHGRDWLHPYGNRGYDFVSCGNILASRVALLLILASCRALVWFLEQPSGSALPDLPCTQYVWSQIQAVHSRSPGKMSDFTVKRMEHNGTTHTMKTQ